MNRSILRRFLLVLIFLAFASAGGAVGLLPPGSSEADFVYDGLQRLDARSLDRYDFQLAPYLLDRDDAYLGPFESLRLISDRSLKLFGFAGEDFRSARQSSASGFESLRGGFAAQPNEWCFVFADFVFDEARAKDPNFSGKKWRGLAGEVENAFLHYQTGRWRFTVGRFASFWGMPESMVLAPKVSLDGLAYSFRWGRLTLSYRLARLDGLSPGRDSVEQFENRYFAGHRLDIHLHRRLRVGLFETVVFGGPGRQIELYYLNPLLFFHGSQLNEGNDDNSLVGLDFSYKPKLGLRLFGQLAIDDYQIDNRDQSDQEPNEIALLVGAHWVEPVRSTDLKVTYSRVTNRTFNQIHSRNRYLYRGELLGSAPGNDYDRWEAEIDRWFGPAMRASISFVHHRQGEGRVTDEWSSPWLDVDGDYHEPFPTGVVETIDRVALGFTAFLLNHFFLNLESGIDRVDNYRHIDNDRRTLPYVQFRLSTFGFSRISID